MRRRTEANKKEDSEMEKQKDKVGEVGRESAPCLSRQWRARDQ